MEKGLHLGNFQEGASRSLNPHPFRSTAYVNRYFSLPHSMSANQKSK